MRVVVALDLDCFYAQVECVARGFRGPLAVRQKGLLVTSNYLARRLFQERSGKSMKKCAGLGEARAVLGDDLLVVSGEDILPYQKASYAVRDAVAAFGPVEKSGLDEFFVDVTEAARASLRGQEPGETFSFMSYVGHVVPSTGEEFGEEDEESAQLLRAGSQVAARARAAILAATGLTASAGVAGNKLLAKFAASAHKPDQQTVVPRGAEAAFGAGRGWREVPGVGRSKTRSPVLAQIEGWLPAGEEAHWPLTCGELVAHLGSERLAALPRHIGEMLAGRDPSGVRPNCEAAPKCCGIEETWPGRPLDSLAAARSALEASPKLVAGLLKRLAFHNRRFNTVFAKLALRYRLRSESYHDAHSATGVMPTAVGAWLRSTPWRRRTAAADGDSPAADESEEYLLRRRAHRALVDLVLSLLSGKLATKRPRGDQPQGGGPLAICCINLCALQPATSGNIEAFFRSPSKAPDEAADDREKGSLPGRRWCPNPQGLPAKRPAEAASPRRDRPAPAPASSWGCASCTFIHAEPRMADFLACELCGLPRR